MTVQPVTASRAVTASSPKSLKDWLTLTKPGITLANLLAASAGLWLGGEGPPHWTTAFWTLLGTALVVASGAALNNVVDVDIDGKMTRTRHRPLVNGRLHRQRALIVGLLLGVAGLVMLMVFIHWTAFCCAAVGLGMYAGLYSLWLKRKTAWSTVIGGVAGAMPPMVGYFAGSGGRLEWAGVLLFLTFLSWQPSHFYPLALKRADEYRAAGIPMWPVVHGVPSTKRQTIGFCMLLAGFSVGLYQNGLHSALYLFAAGSLGIGFLALAIQGVFTRNDVRWAHRMFTYSLLYMLALCAAMVASASTLHGI